ncbi:MAG: hypothetical protein QM802_01560 [Agriterribacter sp.]
MKDIKVPTFCCFICEEVLKLRLRFLRETLYLSFKEKVTEDLILEKATVFSDDFVLSSPDVELLIRLPVTANTHCTAIKTAVIRTPFLIKEADIFLDLSIDLTKIKIYFKFCKAIHHKFYGIFNVMVGKKLKSLIFLNKRLTSINLCKYAG